MVQIFGGDFPSNAIMKKWVVEFKWVIDSTEGDPRSGYLKTPDEQADAIHWIVLDDRLHTFQQIAKSIDINSDSVYTVLTEILGMSKLSARGFLKMLIPEDKLKRVDIYKTLLTCFQPNLKNFYCRLVTQDVTWIHHIKTESKILSKQWKHSGL